MRSVMMTVSVSLALAATGCNTMRSCIVVYVESEYQNTKGRVEYRLEEIPAGSTVIVRPAPPSMPDCNKK